MNNNQIIELINEAADNIKKLHKKAAHEINNRFKNRSSEKQRVKANIDNLIKVHTKILHNMKKEYNSKKIKKYNNKISSLKNKFSPTTGKIINDVIRTNGEFHSTKRLLSELKSDPDYKLENTIKNINKKMDEKLYQMSKISKDSLAKIKDLITRLPTPKSSVKGDKGEKGEDGAKGDRGYKGEIGFRGPKGDKGDRGLKGAKGDKGDKGPKGDKGDKGERGLKGDRGEKGERGQRGDSGLGQKGERGPKGEKGERGERGERGQRGDTGPMGPKGAKGEPGAARNLNIDTDDIHIKSKNKGTLIERTYNGLGLYSGFNKNNDPQILLGKDFVIKNKGNTIFSSDGKEMKIGGNNEIIFEGKINKLKASNIIADQINLGDNKRIFLTSSNENNYISSSNNDTEFHAHPNQGWKFIKNNRGIRQDVINIRNNQNDKPRTTITSNVKIDGKLDIDNISSNKYILTDKNTKLDLTNKKGVLSIESPNGLEIVDSVNKYKFFDVKYNGKDKKSQINLTDSEISINDQFVIKTSNKMINIQNKFGENIIDIPISREAKLKAKNLRVSSTKIGNSMTRCIMGHTKSTCSTDKAFGRREFVAIKLPRRKIISHIVIYNVIDNNMSKLRGAEVLVTDENGKDTFRTVLTSVSDHYNIPVNSYGNTVTIQQLVPNTEISIRNIKVFTRNVI
jgi:hypothetical protein